MCLINTAPSIIHTQKYCFSSTNAGSPYVCTPALCSSRSTMALQGRIPLTHLQQPQLFQHSCYDMNHSASLHLIIRLSILIYFIFYVQCQRSSLKYVPTTLSFKKEKKGFLVCDLSSEIAGVSGPDYLEIRQASDYRTGLKSLILPDRAKQHQILILP